MEGDTTETDNVSAGAALATLSNRRGSNAAIRSRETPDRFDEVRTGIDTSQFC
jgi:hypothetical protein